MLTSGPRQPEQVWTQNYPPPVLKPHRCLWKWPHRKENRLIRRCHPYASKSASQAVLSRMQFTLHATRRTTHGALHLVLAMSAWSVKTLRAGPSRHCRDARVYGHTTRVVLDNEYTPRRLHNIWALEKRATHGCVVVCLCGEVQDTTKNHDH